MALKATIYKASLGIADLERFYYADHALTIARHPSETEQRMMVRLLAFALFADEQLEFGRGISSDDEPALWRKELNGNIQQWIEIGLPDERLLRRASGRAAEVIVIAYGSRALEVWWAKEGAQMQQISNLRVYALADEQATALTALAARNMALQCTVMEGQALFTDGVNTATIELKILK